MKILILMIVLTGLFTLPIAPAHHLSVQGNQLVDAQGHRVVLVGATRWALEFACHGDGHYATSDFQAMKSWGMNTAKLTLSSAFWLNLGGRCPTYRATVAQAITHAEAAGLYIMPVLQWEEPFPAHANDAAWHGGTQYPMPDASALTFWQSFLSTYGTDQQMIVELFSEPHDVSWSTYWHGGTVTTDAGTYQAVGMAALVALANHLAPRMPLSLTGLSWGYSFAGSPPLVGRNLVIGTHVYGYESKSPAKWQQDFGFLSTRYPIVATEFGQLDGGFAFNHQVIAAFSTRWSGMLAWAWTAGHGGPPLLASGRWDGTPNAYGAPIQRAFQHLSH